MQYLCGRRGKPGNKNYIKCTRKGKVGEGLHDLAEVIHNITIYVRSPLENALYTSQTVITSARPFPAFLSLSKYIRKNAQVRAREI